MKIQSIVAKKLLDWRDQNLTSTIPNDLLSPDELAEAMRLHWIESEIAQHRHITNFAARLEDMADAAKSSVDIGDTVTIGEEGQAYTGTVQSIDQNGIRLTFGDRKPRNIDRVFSHSEVKPVATPKIEVPQGSSAVDPSDDRARHGMFRLAGNYATGTSSYGH